MTKFYLTTTQAAEMLGYSVHSVRDMARRKEIPGHRIGRKWLFDATELEAFVTRKGDADRLTI